MGKRTKEQMAAYNRARDPAAVKKNSKNRNKDKVRETNTRNNEKRHEARLAEQYALCEVSDIKYVFIHVCASRVIRHEACVRTCRVFKHAVCICTCAVRIWQCAYVFMLLHMRDL